MENNFKEIDSKKLAVGISSGISIVCGVGAGIGAANNLRLWTTPGAGEHLITRDIFYYWFREYSSVSDRIQSSCKLIKEHFEISY